jgi:hypothetical protein
MQNCADCTDTDAQSESVRCRMLRISIIVMPSATREIADRFVPPHRTTIPLRPVSPRGKIISLALYQDAFSALILQAV